MLAILSDAIECILKYCDEPIPMRAKLFTEAREWLFDQDEKEPFSFLNVCEILNFDPSYLRRGIQAKMQAALVQGTERLGRSTERMKRIGGQVRLRAHSVPRSRPGLCSICLKPRLCDDANLRAGTVAPIESFCLRS